MKNTNPKHMEISSSNVLSSVLLSTSVLAGVFMFSGTNISANVKNDTQTTVQTTQMQKEVEQSKQVTNGTATTKAADDTISNSQAKTVTQVVDDKAEAEKTDNAASDSQVKANVPTSADTKSDSEKTDAENNTQVKASSNSATTASTTNQSTESTEVAPNSSTVEKRDANYNKKSESSVKEEKEYTLNTDEYNKIYSKIKKIHSQGQKDYGDSWWGMFEFWYSDTESYANGDIALDDESQKNFDDMVSYLKATIATYDANDVPKETTENEYNYYQKMDPNGEKFSSFTSSSCNEFSVSQDDAMEALSDVNEENLRESDYVKALNMMKKAYKALKPRASKDSVNQLSQIVQGMKDFDDARNHGVSGYSWYVNGDDYNEMYEFFDDLENFFSYGGNWMYTPEKGVDWGSFTVENSSQEEVDDLIARAEEVKSHPLIAKKIDTAAIDKAEKRVDAELNKTDIYTEESITMVRVYVNNMISFGLNRNDGEFPDVPQIVDSVLDGLNMLVKKDNSNNNNINKKALSTASAKANEALNNAAKYTQDSIAKLRTAFDLAMKVQNNKNATQAEVDTAAKALNTAIEALVSVDGNNGSSDNQNDTKDNNGSSNNQNDTKDNNDSSNDQSNSGNNNGSNDGQISSNTNNHTNANDAVNNQNSASISSANNSNTSSNPSVNTIADNNMVNLVANTNSSSTSVNKTKTTSSSNSSVNALPQTDERSQHAEMATGFVGLLLAVLGFVGISFRKRRN
jgi:hypothetical protein